jgi:hypothetical protein
MKLRTLSLIWIDNVAQEIDTLYDIYKIEA